ncbi:MAG TPA: glycine cleavage system aminomethyltransferase GcvT, partial [Alphaproteobacteria bacterium]|nr:glycine cleavage system aminomethyltransferase GcvT [Alphaproteobacteria bacterium]
MTEHLKRTPLHALHLELGGKMSPFAGYHMAVQYRRGIIAEHNHTRQKASLFDVSHMGQARLRGDEATSVLESLAPADIQGLATGKMRYALLTNEAGGIIDDLIVTRMDDYLFLVVNAARKEADFAHIEANIKDRAAELEVISERALLAVQGPLAATVLAAHAPSSANLAFMSAAWMEVAGVPCLVSRSGYTGEDGFEISAPEAQAEKLARTLLENSGGDLEVAGLGARDSLRLEAGFCLYGADIDATTTPIEAMLAWTIPKRRRIDGGFPGAAVIAGQLADGVARKRVGIRPLDRAPARAHTEIRNKNGDPIGEITSGGFGPTLGGPLAMGYVKTEFAGNKTPLDLIIRGKAHGAEV